MEVFPEVRAIIDLSIFKDKENEALGIIKLSKVCGKCQGGLKSYEVIDSFEKIDKIHTELTKLKIGLSGTGISKSSGAEPRASSEEESSVSYEVKSSMSSGTEFSGSSRKESVKASGAKSTKCSHTESVRSGMEFGKPATKSLGAGSARLSETETPVPHASLNSCDHDLITVDRTIMSYIENTHNDELQKIERDFDVSREIIHTEQWSTVEFIQNKKKIPCYAAKEKFIDFYQRIVTNLCMSTITPNLRGRGLTIKNVEAFLQKNFPKVWVISKDTELNLFGSTDDIKKVEAALDSSKRQENFQPGPFGANTVDSGRRQPLQSESKLASNSDTMIRKAKDEDKTCPICLDEMKVQRILNCKHSFCRECIDIAFKTKSACPVCGEVYGELKGNQPEGGRMTHRIMQMHLPGYDKYDTIEIHYQIPDGFQGKEHPQPGQRYNGTARTAYLPNSPEGKKVLRLLQRAFNQKLIFTVGTSSTTGRSNVVTWNDIHHKTSIFGGPSAFGYPDPTYLARVQDELKAKGIF
ncbi:E3 ubiquitin-protein ligase DTX3L [Mobula hypostoma]|uniref:E3 ubiquitin-protein ligase DTX3L n=1 Tax=Mobula hypostoma TaxID=723540 RepID=UPI002FC3CA64